VFKTFTVTNAGTAPFTITGFTFASGTDFSFNLGGVPGTTGVVQPGQSSPPFTINFHVGLNFGKLTDTFTITDDTATSPHVFPLTGFAFRTAPDFAMSTPDGSPALATITAGQTASYNLVLASIPGFGFGGGNITLSCSGAPPSASCSANPATFVLPDNNPDLFVASVSTTAPPATPTGAGRYHSFWWLAVALPTIVVLKRRRTQLLMIMGTLVLGGIIVSCGSGNNTPPKNFTPPGTYSLMVTATSGNASHTFPMMLIVK
jgi:hypothetical protein